MKYLTALALYAIFSLASALAGVVGIVVGLVKRDAQYTANVMHTMDMLLAALLGWDGRSTVSKECGRSSCRFCRVICAVLNVILERDHCAKEARRQ
jgi:hypothetical protein